MSERRTTWTKRMFMVAPLCAALLSSGARAQAFDPSDFDPDLGDISSYFAALSGGNLASFADRVFDASDDQEDDDDAAQLVDNRRQKTAVSANFVWAATALQPKGPLGKDSVSREWIVHRGVKDNVTRVENTVPALKAAQNYNKAGHPKPRAVELDVQMGKDSAYGFHDERVLRLMAHVARNSWDQNNGWPSYNLNLFNPWKAPSAADKTNYNLDCKHNYNCRFVDISSHYKTELFRELQWWPENSFSENSGKYSKTRYSNASLIVEKLLKETNLVVYLDIRDAKTVATMAHELRNVRKLGSEYHRRVVFKLDPSTDQYNSIYAGYERFDDNDSGQDLRLKFINQVSKMFDQTQGYSLMVQISTGKPNVLGKVYLPKMLLNGADKLEPSAAKSLLAGLVKAGADAKRKHSVIGNRLPAFAGFEIRVNGLIKDANGNQDARANRRYKEAADNLAFLATSKNNLSIAWFIWQQEALLNNVPSRFNADGRCCRAMDGFWIEFANDSTFRYPKTAYLSGDSEANRRIDRLYYTTYNADRSKPYSSGGYDPNRVNEWVKAVQSGQY